MNHNWICALICKQRTEPSGSSRIIQHRDKPCLNQAYILLFRRDLNRNSPSKQNSSARFLTYLSSLGYNLCELKCHCFKSFCSRPPGLLSRLIEALFCWINNSQFNLPRRRSHLLLLSDLRSLFPASNAFWACSMHDKGHYPEIGVRCSNIILLITSYYWDLLYHTRRV